VVAAITTPVALVMPVVAPVMRVVAPVMRVVAPVMRVVAPVMRVVAPVISPNALMPAVTPILQGGVQAVAPVVPSRSLARRAHVATRTPVVSQPTPAPVPVPVPPAAPASAGGPAAGAGSSGTFFASAVLLAMLVVALPRLCGRLRLFAERGRPAAFVLLLAEPG
jgi:hypothetical protein